MLTNSNRTLKFHHIFSVSFENMNGGRGVDCRGHSINEPVQGMMDYKNWRKLARYPRYKSRNPLKLTTFKKPAFFNSNTKIV